MKQYNRVGILITAILSFAGVVNAQKNPYEAMPVKDTDGNVYKTIILREGVWMAENLRTTKFNDGAPIPLVKDRGAWKETKSPGYGWYNQDADYKKSVGAIYNWHSVGTKKLCPTGWHVPTDKEWFDMMEYAGTEERSGDNAARLKEAGTTHWKSPNEGATNAIFFNALPAQIHKRMQSLSGAKRIISNRFCCSIRSRACPRVYKFPGGPVPIYQEQF